MGTQAHSDCGTSPKSPFCQTAALRQNRSFHDHHSRIDYRSLVRFDGCSSLLRRFRCDACAY
jgi:hypothetical protein